MPTDDSSGWSLKVVSIWTLSLVSYLLWGGAAAIHQGYQDQTSAALALQADDALENDSEEPGNMEGPPRIRIRRASGLVALVVVTIAAIWKFVVTSLVQLGHLPQLVPYMLRERIGYLIFCAVVWLATGLGLFWLGKVQQSLESRNPFAKNRRKRKKLPGIRTPKPLED